MGKSSMMARTKEERVAVTLELPLSDPEPRTYIAEESGRIEVDLGHGGAYTVAFRRLHAGLLDSQAKFADGRPVVNKADVIRWLFMKVASADGVRG